jgi:hypothetical protein
MTTNNFVDSCICNDGFVRVNGTCVCPEHEHLEEGKCVCNRYVF